MKILKHIFFIIISIVIIITIYFINDYSQYKSRLSNRKHFDLYIAEKFFNKSDSFYHFLHVYDSIDVWSEVANTKKRPMKWSIDNLEVLDKITLTLKNISGEKMYYMSWGSPFSRIREHYIVYNKGKKTKIDFGGFGCGTGIYLEELKSNETLKEKVYHPLLFNPYTNYPLPLENKEFPKLFKKIYGDSVKIFFKQATYGSPWNKYSSQMITSNYFSISTEKIIDNWRKNKFSKDSIFKKEYENAFYTPINDISNDNNLN